MVIPAVLVTVSTSGTDRHQFILLDNPLFTDTVLDLPPGVIKQGGSSEMGDNDVLHYKWVTEGVLPFDISAKNLEEYEYGIWTCYKYTTPLYQGRRIYAQISTLPGSSLNRVTNDTVSGIKTLRQSWEVNLPNYVKSYYYNENTKPSEPSFLMYQELILEYRMKDNIVQVQRQNRQFYRTATGKIIQDVNTFTPWAKYTAQWEWIGFDFLNVASIPVPTQDQLVRIFNQYARNRYYDTIDIDPSELAVASVRGMKKLDMNTTQYLTELRTAFSGIQSLGSVLRDPTNPKHWVNAYLSNKWGTQMTVKDTFLAASKVAHYVKQGRQEHKVSRAGKSSSGYTYQGYLITIERHIKIYYDDAPNWAMQFIKTGMDWGWYPTFGSTIDFIPFSFCVNWFSNFEDVVSAIDAGIYFDYIQVKACLSSVKKTITLPLSVALNVPVYGKLKLTMYHRYNGDYAPAVKVPKLDLENPTVPNLIDSGALLLQRYLK